MLADPKASEYSRQLALKELELLEVQGFFEVEEERQRLKQQGRMEPSTLTQPPNSPEEDLGPVSQKRLIGSGPTEGHSLFKAEDGFEAWKLPPVPSSTDFFTPNRRSGFFLEKPAKKLDDYWTSKLDHHPAQKDFYIFLQKLPWNGSNKKGNENVLPSLMEISLTDLQGGMLDRLKKLVSELRTTERGSPIPSMVNHNRDWDVSYAHSNYWSPTITISNPDGTIFIRPVWIDTCYGGMYNIAFHKPAKSVQNPKWVGPFGQMNAKTFVQFVNYVEFSITNILPSMELEIGAQEFRVEDTVPTYNLRPRTYVD